MDVSRIGEKLLDLLFPRTRCMACGSVERVNEGMCADCRGKLERYPLSDVCSICGSPSGGREICLNCRTERPSYAAARAAFVYHGPVREFLHCMKFQGEFDLPTRLLSRELASLVKRLDWPVDCVLGVPSTPETRRKRGYNQAEVLARRTAKRLGLPHAARVLAKKRGTRSQVGLGAEERRLNLKGSILPGKRAERVRGKDVLLIDDIYTTGATAEVCAKALMTCGARSVRVLCAARVSDSALAACLAGQDAP